MWGAEIEEFVLISAFLVSLDQDVEKEYGAVAYKLNINEFAKRII